MKNTKGSHENVSYDPFPLFFGKTSLVRNQVTAENFIPSAEFVGFPGLTERYLQNDQDVELLSLYILSVFIKVETAFEAFSTTS